MRDRRGAACRAVSHRLLIAASSLFVFTGAPASAAPAEPALAEYAIRWNAAEGGPGTAQQVIALLGMKKPQTSAYRVEYYDVPAGGDTRGFLGVVAKAHGRFGPGRPDLETPRRSRAAGLGVPAQGCTATQGRGRRRLRGQGGGRSRVFVQLHERQVARPAARHRRAPSGRASRTCDAGRRPASKSKSGASRGNAWSSKYRAAAPTTPAPPTRSGAQVAAPLIAAGIVPSAQSKTELGSRCE